MDGRRIVGIIPNVDDQNNKDNRIINNSFALKIFIIITILLIMSYVICNYFYY